MAFWEIEIWKIGIFAYSITTVLEHSHPINWRKSTFNDYQSVLRLICILLDHLYWISELIMIMRSKKDQHRAILRLKTSKIELWSFYRLCLLIQDDNFDQNHWGTSQTYIWDHLHWCAIILRLPGSKNEVKIGINQL